MREGYHIAAFVLVGFLAAVCVGELNAGQSSALPGYALETGDVNGDWLCDIGDPIYLLSFLFGNGPAPVPLAYCAGDLPAVKDGDMNGDGSVDIGDPINLLAWLFGYGDEPAAACGASWEKGGNPNPRVVPPNARAHGMYYGEWSGVWWQWATDYPAATNPVMDLTGEFASLGQSGSVWLLAGTFGQTAVRTVTIPAGKTLFFPIVNQVWVNIPELGDNPWSPEQEAFARDLIKGLIDGMVNLTCQVDGRAIKDIASYRCQTPADGEYMMVFPVDNTWGIPAGTYGPTVDDGVYLMLAPLTPGPHTIHFTAANGDGTWGLDVTYNLTVKS